MADNTVYQEAQLIEQLHQGSEPAFTTIYHQLYQRVYFFARRFVEPGVAEDITSECFIQLWHHRLEHHSVDGMAAFLHVATRNRCLNWLRDEKNRSAKHAELLAALATSQESDLALEQVRVELVNLIYAAVERLPARMKEVFLLSYREGLKPADIAQRLQLSVQTVSNQKLSAIKLLKAALADQQLLAVLYLLLQLGARK